MSIEHLGAEHSRREGAAPTRTRDPDWRELLYGGEWLWAVGAALLLLSGVLYLSLTGHIRSAVYPLAVVAFLLLLAHDKSLLLCVWLLASPIVSWYTYSRLGNDVTQSASLMDFFSFDRIALVCLATSIAVKKEEPIGHDGVRWAYFWMLLFIMVLVWSSATRSYNKNNALAVAFDSSIVPLLVFYCSSKLLSTESGRRTLSSACVALSLLLVLIGAAEIVISKDPLRRLRWPFIYWETYGFVLCMLFIAVSYRYAMAIREHARGAVRGGYALLMILMVAGIFLTLTRNVWIVWLLGSSYYLLRTRRIRRNPMRLFFRRLLFCLAVAAAVVAVFLPGSIMQSPIVQSRVQNTGTIENRMGTYAIGLQAFRSSPLTGIGFRNFRDYTKRAMIPQSLLDVINPGRSTIHNYYIALLAETGIPGLLFLLLAILALSRRARSVMLRATESGEEATFLWGAMGMSLVLMLLLSGVAYDPIFDEPFFVTKLFFVLMGSLFAPSSDIRAA